MLLRRARWLRALMLKRDPPSYHRVCSRHFVSGKPAVLGDVDNVDWTPSLHILKTHSAVQQQDGVPSWKDISITDADCALVESPECDIFFNLVQKVAPIETRTSDLNSNIANYESGNMAIYDVLNSAEVGGDNLVSSLPSYAIFNDVLCIAENNGGTWTSISSDHSSVLKQPENLVQRFAIVETGTNNHNGNITNYDTRNTTHDTLDDAGSEGNLIGHFSHYVTGNTSSNSVIHSDACVQTEECLEKEARQMQAALNRSGSKLKKIEGHEKRLQHKLEAVRGTVRLTVASLKTNDTKCKYFTGLKFGRVLMHLFNALEKDIPSFSELTKEEAFVLTLRKLRLNEPFCTLGYLYNLNQSVISNYFYETIDGIFLFMKGLVRFPSRNVLRQHLPLAFKTKYKDALTVIVDCFEIFMESPNPKSMTANANVFSNYKKHKTVKVLVGISASGNIIYVSEAFGGRSSDREIIKMSGFLDMIEEGDFVMADRGFLIDELLAPLGASVAYPSFKKKNHQLEPLDAVNSKELSSLRIHVERLMGVLRQQFLILTDTVPISLIQRWNNDTPAIDQILMVAAGLVNLCPSVVGQ